MRICLHPTDNSAGGTKPLRFSKEGVKFWLRSKKIEFKETRETGYHSFDFGNGTQSFPIGHSDRIDALVSQAEVARHILSDKSVVSNVLEFIIKNSHPTRRDAVKNHTDRMIRILQHYSGQASVLSNLEELLFSVLGTPSKVMLSFYFSEFQDLIDFKLPVAEWMYDWFFSRPTDPQSFQDYYVLFENDSMVIDSYKRCGYDLVYYRLVANVPQEGKLITLLYDESKSSHLMCYMWTYKNQDWAQLHADDPRWLFGHASNLYGDDVRRLVNKPLPIRGLVKHGDDVPMLPPAVRIQIAGEGSLRLAMDSLPIEGQGVVRPLPTPKMIDQLLELDALERSFKQHAAEEVLYVLFGRFFFKQLQERKLLKRHILS